jgi:transcriptional regulator with XRE-family HTH domain
MPARPQDAQAVASTAQTLSAALRRQRLLSSLTQAELSEKVGISLEAYSRLERGLSLPSFPTLLRLCAMLDITPDALLLSGLPPQSDQGKRRKNPARVRPRLTRVITSGGLPQLRTEPDPGVELLEATEEAQKTGEVRGRRWRRGGSHPEPPRPAREFLRSDPDLPPASEQEPLAVIVSLLACLDHADQAAVAALVRHFARRAAILPDPS